MGKTQIEAPADAAAGGEVGPIGGEVVPVTPEQAADVTAQSEEPLLPVPEDPEQPDIPAPAMNEALIRSLVEEQVKATLNAILPELVADLVGGGTKADHEAAQSAEAERLAEERKRADKAAKAAEKQAREAAEKRLAQEEEAAAVHAEFFGNGVPTADAETLKAVASEGGAALLFSDGQTFAVDYQPNVSGSLVWSNGYLTVNRAIEPGEHGQAFHAKLVVLATIKGPVAVCDLGAGLHLGGGNSARLPANSLAFRPADAA